MFQHDRQHSGKYTPVRAPVRDIAVTNIKSRKTVVGQGFTIYIDVTVKNQGNSVENFNVTIYANTTTAGTEQVTLAGKGSKIITLTWDTTDFSKGNYTISAYATQVPGETDTADNTLVNGVVIVTNPGDVNFDGIVNILDAAGISAHWFPGPPVGPLGYDPNFDLDNDGPIGVSDAAIVSAHWTGPPKGPLAP